MDVVVGGQNMYDVCGMKQLVAETFISVSAANTQTEANLWFITGVLNGPAVLTRNTNAVAVAAVGREIVPFQAVTSPNGTTVPQQSIAAASPQPWEQLFNGSVIMNITLYVDSQSLVLVTGSYLNFLRSQAIIAVLAEQNITSIEWIGFLKAPTKLDETVVQPTPARSSQPVLTGGAISSIVVLGAVATGLGAFIIVEAALTSAVTVASAASTVGGGGVTGLGGALRS